KNNPNWYHNLKAHPEVTIEIGTEEYEATAMLIDGEERDRLYATQAEQMPIFDTYAQKAEPRIIPVFRIVRKGT
ncbi:MAG: nitroreductase family deazaflavin-dependent oxidoreductase, partial [Actinomycetia bacterium]|nr:nitroreductase family deazaflavin-dependent oxidoreductase [Actinomycetes bacterium]